MSVAETRSVSTRTIRFHDYGEPSDVLRLEETELPGPGAKRSVCASMPAVSTRRIGRSAGDCLQEISHAA